MSFSGDIKEELSKISNLANKDCVKLEFIGYMISSNIDVSKNKVRYATENEYNINRFNKLLNNLNIDYDIKIQGKVYVITFDKVNFDEIEEVEGNFQIKSEVLEERFLRSNDLLYKSLIRGAFLGAGSLNNPNNKYHLEILFSTKKNAEYVSRILKSFSIESKILNRKKSCSLYMKEAEEISKFLALLNANKAVLNFEEIRVLRDTRNNINRLVNCETANINKTINAAVYQIDSIEYLKQNNKFEELPSNLKEIAELRLNNPEASLVELGEMLQEPLGKSGVNHRLKKICEIAEECKNGEKIVGK